MAVFALDKQRYSGMIEAVKTRKSNKHNYMSSQLVEREAIDDKVLHLRNFPDDLHSLLKSKAALMGISMKEFIIDTLWEAVSDKKRTRAS